MQTAHSAAAGIASIRVALGQMPKRRAASASTASVAIGPSGTGHAAPMGYSNSEIR